MLRTLIRKRRARILWPVAGACLVAYFVFYLLQGERGIGSLMHLKREVRDARAELAQAQSREKQLEDHVRLLRPDTLDLDMLDERARETLGYAHPDDLVVPTGMDGTDDAQPETNASNIQNTKE